MKKAPYYFLLFLVLTIVYIVGFRMGQKTEKTNKVIDFVLSITPTPPLITETPLKYKNHKSKRLGITLVYPSNLKLTESTNSPQINLEIIK